jgi:hypothetical protein
LIQNSIFKTFPSVLHSPVESEYFSEISKIALSQNNQNKQKIESDLTILTWNNKKEASLVERSLEIFGVSPMILGKEIENWKHKDKIRLAAEALLNIKTEYVMGVDAFDVVFLNHPELVLRKFKDMKKSMVFNASSGQYPKIQKQLDFERSLTANSIYAHLNAGVWIAEIETARKFWNLTNSQKIENEASSLIKEDICYEQYRDSEQLRAKIAFKLLHPIVSLDYQCEIFQCISKRMKRPHGPVFSIR